MAAAMLWLAGCSMPIPGFVDASPTGAIKAKTYPFSEEDWPKAEAALITAIRADNGDDPAQWSNSSTGRRGAVAGLGARFQRSGATCRVFVARISEDGDARAVQGAACEKSGEVTVSDAAPFKGL
jgi:surface antigen